MKISFDWECSDCREKGRVLITFPCHPEEITERVMSQHREAEHKRHCMCPAYPLRIKPVLL